MLTPNHLCGLLDPILMLLTRGPFRTSEMCHFHANGIAFTQQVPTLWSLGGPKGAGSAPYSFSMGERASS